MNLSRISLPCLVAKANNKSQNSQNSLHGVKSFFHMPLETLESAKLSFAQTLQWVLRNHYLAKGN
jgi:hypothetical protein